MTVLSVKKIAGSGAAVGEPAWSNPGHITASDDLKTTKSIDAGAHTGELHAYNFGFAIPYNATVTGVLVEIERSGNALNCRDYSIYLRNATGSATGDNFAVTDAWPANTDEIASYGGETEDFGVTLTPSLINDTDFGIVFSGENNSAGNRTLRVDAIWITVYYENKCKLFWMIGGGQAGFKPDASQNTYDILLSKITSNLSSNDYIDGVFLIARWNNIEPIEGEFTWTRLDGVIDAIVAAGLPFKFGVMPGRHCPDWLLENEDVDLFETTVTNPVRPNYGETEVFPKPWNSTYKTSWFAVLSAVAAHFETKGYDDHCEVIKVVPWAFLSLECILPKEPDDMTAWAALDATTKLPQVFTDTLAHYATKFPKQRLCISGLNDILNSSALTEQLAAIALTGYSNVLDMQSNTMNGRSDLTYESRWQRLRNYQANYPTIRTGCQALSFMILPVDAIAERHGSIRRAVANIRNCGCDAYYEIWYGNGKDENVCEAVATLLAGGDYVGGTTEEDDEDVEDGSDEDVLSEKLHPHGTIMSITRPGQILHQFRIFRA